MERAGAFTAVPGWGGVAVARKVRREDLPLWTGPGRKFAMPFLPALITGAWLPGLRALPLVFGYLIAPRHGG
jgi:hypothetical protein